MLDVVILGVAAVAAGLPEQAPALRLVAGAAKQLAVDEALHGQNRMSVGLLPVGTEPRGVQREHARGEVRTIDAAQDEKPAVVGEQAQTPPPLLVAPANSSRGSK